MKKQSVQKSVSLISLLATCLSTGVVFAEWNNDSAFNGYNPGYGNFPPEDIEQKLFGHMGSETDLYETNQYQAQVQNTEQDRQWPTPQANLYTAPAPSSNNSQTDYRQQNYSQQAYTQPNYPTKQSYQQPYPQQQYKTSPYSGYPSASRLNNPGGNDLGENNHWGNNLMTNPLMVNNPMANNQGMNFSHPWKNNGSNFSMPWGNDSTGGNMMPWGNKSNNTANRNPWDNTGSNNSTSFTPPWNNKGSNFSMPWGGNPGFNP